MEQDIEYILYTEARWMTIKEIRIALTNLYGHRVDGKEVRDLLNSTDNELATKVVKDYSQWFHLYKHMEIL